MKSHKQFKYVLTDNEDRTITIAKAENEEQYGFVYNILVEDEPVFGFEPKDIPTIIEAFENINHIKNNDEPVL